MNNPLATWSDIEQQLEFVEQRLRQAASCPNVGLSQEYAAECLRLAALVTRSRLAAARCIESERRARRQRKQDDPLRWLMRNPVNPEPSTREVQHV